MSTGRRLRYLVEEGVGITQHRQVQRQAALHLAAERVSVHLQRHSGYLYVNGGRRLVRAEADRQSHHSLATDRADFGAGAVRRSDHQRCDALDRKVHLLDRTGGLVEALSVFQIDLGQMRP